MLKIKIGENFYQVKYGYGALKLLGSMWKLPGFTEVAEKVAGLIPKDGDTAEILKFENLDLMADIIWAGISNADTDGKVDYIDSDVIVDAIFQDMEILKDVFELFMASMPKAKQPVEPPKKKRTAPVKKKANP